MNSTSELSLLRIESGKREKELTRRIQHLEERNSKLQLELEETRRGAESRIESLYREMKSSRLNAQSEEAPHYNYPRSDFGAKSERIVIVKKEGQTAPFSGPSSMTNFTGSSQTRQIDSLNFVISTKDQEIRAYEDRLLLIKQQYEQQLAETQEHINSQWKHRMAMECKNLEMNYDKQLFLLQTQNFQKDFISDQSLDRLRTQVNDKQREIDSLTIKLQHLQANFQEVESLQAEVNKLNEEIHQVKQDHRLEVQLLQQNFENEQRSAYQHGYDKAIDDHQPVRPVYLPPDNQRELQLESENQQLQMLIKNYKHEIEQWKEKYDLIVVKQRDEIERIRKSFENQRRNQYELRDSDYEKVQFQQRLDQMARQLQSNKLELESAHNENRSLKQQLLGSERALHELEFSKGEVAKYKSELESLKMRVEFSNQRHNDEKKLFNERQQQLELEFEHQRSHLEEELTNKQKELEEIYANHSSNNLQIKKLMTQLEQSRKDEALSNQRYESQLAQLQASIAQYEQQISTMQNNLLQQNGTIEDLSNEIDSLQDGLTKSEVQTNKLRAEAKGFEIQIAQLKQRNSDLEEYCQSLKDDLESKNQEFEQVYETIQSLEQECAKFSTSKQQLERKIQNLDEDLQSKEEIITTLEFQLKSSNQQRSEWETRFNQLQREYKKIQQEHAEMSTENQLLQEGKFELETQRDRLQNKVDMLSIENSMLKQQSQQRQKMTQDRIEEFDLLKDKLEKHEPSRQSVVTTQILESRLLKQD